MKNIAQPRSAQQHRRPPVYTVFLTGTLLLMGAAYPSFAADSENRFEKQLAPVPAAPAGEWWKASWREGWSYQHRGEFSLSSRVRIREKSQVSWWQGLISNAAEYVGELNLEARGNSLAESGVLQNQNGEILLSRYYPRTDVTRAIFRTPVADRKLLFQPVPSPPSLAPGWRGFKSFQFSNSEKPQPA